MTPSQRLQAIERVLSESAQDAGGDYVRIHRAQCGEALRLAREGGDGWIRVEDVLPEKTCICLVYNPTAKNSRGKGVDLDVFMEHAGKFREGIPVTHWQPLPEPPHD